jgi:phosphoribosyl 1,2-cyclic phosphodiesterase
LTSKQTPAFSVTFWGVRGSLASPGREFQKAGGNTICAELRCGGRTIIFDAGTGVRALGARMAERGETGPVDMMFTHVHYDHVEGLPFFAPFYMPGRKVDLWLGPVDGAANPREAVEGLMRRPYFPVGPEVFAADVRFRAVKPGTAFSIGDGIEVRTAPLNHPGGATGYRIDFAGRSFAFITDLEHVPGKQDRRLLELLQGVDLFAYDISFTDAELPDFRGYGHSTWEESLRLREAAGAGAVLGLHHMPFRTDGEVDRIEREIRRSHAKSGVAREGDTVEL